MQIKLFRSLLAAAVTLGLVTVTGCSEPELQIPVYKVAPDTLVHKVQTEGELFAVNSVTISAPRNVQGPRFIASLAREYSRVEPGDVVVTFDATQLVRSQRKANSSLSSVQADEQQKLAEQQNEQTGLGLDQTLIAQEFTFADRFSIDDVQIRSKLEILDSMQNKEYLGEKQQYLGWQEQSFSQRSSGELELLQLQRGQQQNLLQQAESGLAALEVKAPHAGILLFDTNWRGEKPEVGGMVFPGSKIGSIPDLALQHLKLQVIEQEAIGLREVCLQDRLRLAAEFVRARGEHALHVGGAVLELADHHGRTRPGVWPSGRVDGLRGYDLMTLRGAGRHEEDKHCDNAEPVICRHFNSPFVGFGMVTEV